MSKCEKGGTTWLWLTVENKQRMEAGNRDRIGLVTLQKEEVLHRYCLTIQPGWSQLSERSCNIEWLGIP